MKKWEPLGLLTTPTTAHVLLFKTACTLGRDRPLVHASHFGKDNINRHVLKLGIW